MAAKKTAAKSAAKTVTKAATKAKSAVKRAAAKAAAVKAPSKPKLDVRIDPLEPAANFSFTVEVHGLEEGDEVAGSFTRPGGRVEELTSVRVGSNGFAQWMLISQESGDHQLNLTSDKGDASQTITLA